MECKFKFGESEPTRSQKFIEKYRRVLDAGPEFYNPDTEMMSTEDYNNSDLKVLIVFPSPVEVKDVSSTKPALNDIVKSICNQPRSAEQNAIPWKNGFPKSPNEDRARGPLNVFVDFAFMPGQADIKLYDKHQIPYAIGQITHLDVSHFDVVGFSISVLSDNLGAPQIITTFKNCDTPIYPTWSERKDLPLSQTPLIFAGGITCAVGDIMFGDLQDGTNRQSFIDVLYLGAGEKLDLIFERLIKSKDMKVQDFIDTLFDLYFIYQPQAYRVTFNDKNQIVENVKINPKAQDFVSPYYPLELDPAPGIARTIINGRGGNTGTAQSQVSEGAHMKGNRIRTSEGLVKIEDLCTSEIGDSDTTGIVDTIDGPGKLYHRFTQGVKPVRVFTLKSGIKVGFTDEHPIEQWKIGDKSSYFVRADELSVGDFFMTKKSHVFGLYPMSVDEAEFLGRMVGDGSYNLYNDPRGREKPYHKMYLACSWAEKDYCIDLLNRANINHTLDEKQGRHCRFWIKALDKKGRSMKEFWGFNKFYKENEGKPSTKYIPEPAYRLSEECMKAFLKGFHDADGCSSTVNGLSKVTFDSCHESIIDDIQQMLLMVGIPSRKHFSMKHRVSDDRYGFKDTDNEHWYLAISAEYFDRFNALGVNKQAKCRSVLSKEHLPMPSNIRELLYKCNISTSKRSRAFSQVRRRAFTKSLADSCGIQYPDVVFDEIVKIEDGVSETYDLSVLELEKLTANGCSVHNCSASGCCNFCSEGNYCLPEGSLVKSTNGLTRIEEFKIGDHVVLCGKTYEVKDTVVVGMKPTITFEMFNHQRVKVANTHLILSIENGILKYKRAYDIKEGDFIAYERSKVFGSNHSDVAYIVGAVLGDGLFYPEKNLVKVYSPIHEVDEMSENFKEFSKIKHSEGIYEFSKNTKEFTKRLLEVGLTHETSKTKRIPKWFFNADKETVIALLQGMFDTDGNISLDKRGRAKISYSTVSKQLAEDLVNVLSMFGICATVYDNKHKAHFKSNGEFIAESFGYEVSLVGNENIRRFKEIGFHLKSKKSKLESAVEYAWEADYIPTFEERVRELYHGNKEFNRFVRKNADSVRKTINGWANIHWLSRRHHESIKQFYSGELLKDYTSASEYEFIQVVSVESGAEEMMYDINVEDSHAYSMCGWVSHNTGGWTEKTKEQILSDCKDAKKFGFCYKYKAYSFNMNYLTDYKGMLGEFMKIFPKVTFINMRMEELGRDVDAMRIMKLIGSNRISFPLEGLSPRIQNNLLNKCLSEEALNNALGWCVHGGMADIKCVTRDALTFVKGVGLIDQAELMAMSKVMYGTFKENTLICRFSRGISIEGTPNHRVLVKPEIKEENFKELSELQVGDVVYVKLGSNCYGSIQSTTISNVTTAYTSVKDDRELKIDINSDIAMLLGWCVGDGSVETSLEGKSDRVRFYFASDELDVAKSISDTLKRLGYWSSESWVKGTVYCVASYHKNFAVFMSNLIGRRFDGKKVPSIILKSPKSVQVAFIRGLMGADGTICRIKKGKNYHDSIAIVLSNRGVLSTVQMMLLNMGIVSHLTEGSSKCNGKRFITYRLVILRQHHKKFLKEVGFEGRKDKFILSESPSKGLRDSIKEVNGFIPIKLESVEESVAEVYKFQTYSHVYTTNGIVSHNCGGIFTGYEEQEDIDWICSLVDKFKVQAKREDGTFNFRLKCTPLVHYPLTPLEYLERKSTRKSYEGEHWLTDEWYEQFKAHDVFFKVNGFRFSTFMEQTIVDLGRSATGWLWNILQSDSKIYSLRSVASEENINALKALVNPDYFFNDRDPEHYISICHRIHIDLMGSYIPRARRLLRCKKEGDVFKNVPDIRCLKTFEGAKTKCYKMCVAKDPLKIYNDVTMDEEGNLHGEFRDLKGCERCPDNAHRMARLNREYKASLDSNGIMAIPRIKKAQKIRFTLVRNPEYDVLNPNNTAHTFGSRILQADESLVDSFRELTRHSMFWQADPDMPYMCSGYQIVDTVWSSKVFDKVKLAVAQANQMLKSLQIVKVTEEFIDEDIRVDDINIFRFESDLPFELFESSALSYKGEVKVKKDVNSEIIQDTTLVPPVFRTKGKTIGYFACPTRYNPYYYLQGFFNAKKITTNTLVESTKLYCSMVVRESMSICKCGKEKSVTSLITGKSLPFGKQCLLKALLLKEFK